VSIVTVRDDVRVPVGEPRPVPPPVAAADPPRPRAGGGGWLLPPWSRAPLLPFGQPAVLLAVLAAAAILACAGASAPLFLSSASSAALQRLVAAGCPDAATGAVRLREPGQQQAWLDGKVRSAMAGAGFAPPELSAVGADPRVLGRPEVTRPPLVRAAYRDRALDEVDRLPGAVGGRGIWVSQYAAQRASVRPGDQATLGSAKVRVVGVYRDFYAAPLRPYWCSYAPLVLNPASVDPPPPTLALTTDPQTFADLVGVALAEFSWTSAVPTAGLTESRGQDLARRQAAAYTAAGLPPLEDLARTAGGPGQFPVLSDRARLIRDGLRGPVLPIALGGALLALLLVGAAGSYWADRRFAEVRLLTARGVGPAALAGKAVLELALPAAAGTVLGWVLARQLVTGFGPSADLDPAASRQAALVAVAGLIAGLALLGAVAGLRSRNATERPVGARRSRWVLLPWELALLAGAAGSYLALRDGGAVTVVQNVAQVDLLAVLFPLLFILGGSVLAVRLLTLLLPVLAGRAGRLSPAWYLAARRLTAARAAAVVLLAAAATPVAISGYSAGLTTGSEQTLEAKARVFTGSDVAVLSNDPIIPDAGTDRVGTVVLRYLYGQVDGTDVAVVAVDPRTFAATAYWRPEFADRPLAGLLGALTGPAPGGRVPAVLVDPRRELPDTADVTLGTSMVRVAEVQRAELFPGRRLPVPMIVVDRARVEEVDPHAGSRYELWTRGAAAPAQAAVLAQGGALFDTIDQGSIFQAADYLGITWTFGYLAALAALVGLVSVGALLLYVETRQRTRTASYALGRRMGLTRAVHLRSLLAELGLLLGVAYAVGVVLSRVALGLVHGLLDVDESRPPGTLLVVPVGVLAGAAVVVAAVGVLTALYAQRVADRTPPAEVLRLGS